MERLLGGDRVLDPTARDFRGKHLSELEAERLVEADLEEIRSSDAVLANCWKPSWGTPMEVFYAHRVLGLPVVVIAPDRVSPWLKVNSRQVTGTVAEAVTYLEQILGR